MARSPDAVKQYSAERNALTEMTEDLCKALPIDDLLPKMIAKRVIEFQDKAEIRKERTDRDKVDLFISKLTKEMDCGVNDRFYKFIEAMEESPKCDFLVERMKGRISYFKGTLPSLRQTAHSVSSQSSVTSQSSVSSRSSVTSQPTLPTTEDHNGHPITNLKLMHKHVIPRVSADWEIVAAHLEYTVPVKNLIKRANRGLPTECCTTLLEDWISTDNGVKPKTWEKFIEVLDEIGSLAMVTKQIKQCLYQEGVLGGQRPSQQQMMSHQPLSPPAPCPTEFVDNEKRLELQKEVFTSCQQYIVQYLSPDDVMDTLRSKSLIGDSAYQQLRLSVKTIKEKNRTIVDELANGGPGVFEEFCAILKKNKRTKHIADHLEKKWRELLQSLQNDDEQSQYSPPVRTKVPTALPQANTVTNTTKRQWVTTAPQQSAMTQETTTPVGQGQITASTEQPVLESYECYEDSKVTSPESESEEGYFQSTGINLEQERNGQVDTSSMSAAAPLPATTKATTTPDDVTVTHYGVTAANHDVTTATAPANVPMAPAAGDVTHNVSDEDSLVTGKDSKRCMRLMRIYVIPKIDEEWEAVAAFLDYSIQAKEDIKKAKETPRECCTALLEDWVTTDNGVKPKTWKKLIEVLSEIDELEQVIDEIKQGLMSEGVVLDAPNQSHPSSHNLEDQQGHPHEFPHNLEDQQSQTHRFPYDLEDQSTDDATDLDWNHQPESSVDTMAESGLTLNNRPSYNVPSVDVDRHYGRQMGANQPPQPVYRQQPQTYAFIIYAKEESDPHGEQVLSLSNLLYNCKINCDIDLYHIDDNDINTNWPYWVENTLNNYIPFLNCCIIFVCSPKMISLLDNAEADVEMVAAHIHSHILRQYLQQYTQKFLPLSINDPSTDFVPASLSRQMCFYFPYDKLCEMSQSASTHDVIHHPEFASLKSLVYMLTGQQEYADVDQENLGSESAGGTTFTELDANTTPHTPGTVSE